jgi:hypothetical protein
MSRRGRRQKLRPTKSNQAAVEKTNAAASKSLTAKIGLTKTLAELSDAQKAAAAGPAAAAPAPAAAPAAKPPTATQDAACQTNKLPTNNAPNTTADAEARLQALEAKVAALNQQLGPVGGTVTVASVSEQGTTLQQTFPTPVAIGYHGFEVALVPRPDGKSVSVRY